jgi:hypothetical protein
MKTQINEIQEARAGVRPTTHPTFVRFDPSADQAVKGRSTFDDTRSEDSRHSGAGIRAENFFHQTTQKVASPIGPALGYGPFRLADVNRNKYMDKHALPIQAARLSPCCLL